MPRMHAGVGEMALRKILQRERRGGDSWGAWGRILWGALSGFTLGMGEEHKAVFPERQALLLTEAQRGSLLQWE